MPMLKLISKQMFREPHIHQYDEYLIRLQKVIKAYETEAGDFLALKGINLLIGSGEFVGVIGKSGSGKSTLINMISGIDRPTNGEVHIGGMPVHTFDEGEMAKWRGRNLGIVFQFFQLLPILTVIENVMLPMDFCHMYNMTQRRKRAYEVLDMVGVADHANKFPSQLSGGEQQRVAIARALANDPPIILADEPTGNLDSKTAERIFSLFEALVAGGKTIVMVTHDSDLAERVKRTIVIADGEIIEGYLARTFPSLTQPQLIWMTSALRPQRYPAGSVIIQNGEAVEGLYIVTRGSVEVTVAGSDEKETVVSRIERGQYFGEMELMNGGVSHATVHAQANTPVELAVLDRDSFTRLVSESETTRRELERISQLRLGERLKVSEGLRNA